MELAGKANDAASLVLLLPRFEAELLRVNTFLHRFETTGA
jgi:hypothetical protein